jgi:putative hydrolase of the HAD superfamily
MTVAAILLDVGGVFVLPNVDEMLEAARRFAPDTTPEDLTRGHFHGIAAMDRSAATKGISADWRAYNKALVGELVVEPARREEAIEVLAAAMGSVSWSRVIPGAVEALQSLAARDVAIGIVSNSNGTVETQLRTSNICQVGPGCGVTVGVVLDSFVVGVEKPNPLIFERALSALGVPADLAVHVGDTGWADIAGAAAAGIRGVHVDPYGLCPDVDDHEHIRHLAGLEPLLDRL